MNIIFTVFYIIQNREAAGIAVCGAGALVGVPAIIGAIGFGAGGVAAGSWAAAWATYLGGTILSGRGSF